MRNRKFVKPMLIVVAMILVCIMSVFATIAYLTDDTEVVKNTFTVGNIEIELDEAKVNEYGELVYKTDDNGDFILDAENNKVLADRVIINNYKLVPNRKYVKDPTVTVKAMSEDCYLRAFITVTKGEELKALGYTADIGANSFLKKFNVELGEGWTAYACNYDETAKAFVFEVRYDSIVEYNGTADQTLPVFTAFTTDNLSNTALGTLAGMNIDVKAQAIQSSTFASASDAFAALDAANA